VCSSVNVGRCSGRLAGLACSVHNWNPVVCLVESFSPCPVPPSPPPPFEFSTPELNEIKENGGKLFEADMEVLSLQDPLALPFPDLDAWPLVGADGGEPKTTEQLSARLAGKVTLVTVQPIV
jgi:hypothetical protein